MKITINGEEETIEKDSLTISELLVHKNVDMPEMVTVEYNGDMLEREKFDSQSVKEGDKVEFLYFMGGGKQKRRLKKKSKREIEDEKMEI